jgi:hypothetical protein
MWGITSCTSLRPRWRSAGSRVTVAESGEARRGSGFDDSDDRRVWAPVGLPGRGAREPVRCGRVGLPRALRCAEHVRPDPRSRRRALVARGDRRRRRLAPPVRGHGRWCSVPSITSTEAWYPSPMRSCSDRRIAATASVSRRPMRWFGSWRGSKGRSSWAAMWLPDPSTASQCRCGTVAPVELSAVGVLRGCCCRFRPVSTSRSTAVMCGHGSLSPRANGWASPGGRWTRSGRGPGTWSTDQVRAWLHRTVAGLAVVERDAPELRGTVRGHGSPQRQGAPGVAVRTERLDRRSADDVVARDHRWLGELGLPVRVGARCEPDVQCPVGPPPVPTRSTATSGGVEHEHLVSVRVTHAETSRAERTRS